MNTRRDFLTSCSLLAAGAALDPVETLAAPGLWRGPSIDRFGLTEFSRCVDTRFRVLRDSQRALGLTLVEALGRSRAGASEHQFSLLFQGPHDGSLAQGTYAFEHATLGRFSMFIVPVGLRDGTACHYEAIFNRTPGAVV